MKRIIKAAESADVNDKLQEALTTMKDNFDFIVDGLELLDRRGAEASNEALIIAERFNTAIDGVISEIAEKIEE